MRILSSVFLLATTIYFIACTEDTGVNPPNSNSPVIASTQNAFAYTLVANSFSDNKEFDLDFTSDSLAYSLVVTGYKAGNGSLTVEMNASSSYIFSEPLQSNKVIAFTQTNHGIPEKFKIVFNDFTGTLNFALAKSGSGN